ncbi:MAG: NAD-dependent epimerase/dehydratase family protein [Chloroflexi bacterium]|nr:NAD-dependent epimerase/dehydratase family protein [Chloroflexota bacterium]
MTDKKQVLVTGGAGFVGSAVVDACRALGNDVVVIDDLSTGARANVAPGVSVRVADVSDSRAVADAIGGERFDAVVHLASKTKVVESMGQPELYERVIVGGTRVMLGAARRAGATTFVNFSSGGVVYGETPECASETREIGPRSPYGTYKAEAEALVAASGLNAVTLRPANIYGRRQRPDLEGGVVAIFMRCWREGTPLTVFGDGTMVRDYVYANDVAEFVIAAIDRGARGVYNVGTGVATSVNDLIDAMTEVLGPPPGIVHAPERPGELKRSCIDPRKAARDGLWKPRTSLADGLRALAAALP